MIENTTKNNTRQTKQRSPQLDLTPAALTVYRSAGTRADRLDALQRRPTAQSLIRGGETVHTLTQPASGQDKRVRGSANWTLVDEELPETKGRSREMGQKTTPRGRKWQRVVVVVKCGSGQAC